MGGEGEGGLYLLYDFRVQLMNQLARQRRHATEDRGEHAQRFVLRLLGQFQDVTWRAHKRIAREREREKEEEMRILLLALLGHCS